jgi:hypothetical protein
MYNIRNAVGYLPIGRRVIHDHLHILTLTEESGTAIHKTASTFDALPLTRGSQRCLQIQYAQLTIYQVSSSLPPSLLTFRVIELCQRFSVNASIKIAIIINHARQCHGRFKHISATERWRTKSDVEFTGG